MLLFSPGGPIYVLAQFPASWRGICVQKPKRDHYEQGVIFEIILKSWLLATFLLLIHKSNRTASFSMMIYFLLPREQEMNDEFLHQLGIQSFKNISRE